MSKNTHKSNSHEASASKKAWATPTLQRMVAGGAESQRGGAADGGGGFQGS